MRVFLIILLILVLIITSKVQINFKELYLENISKEKPKSINVVVTLKVLSIFPILKITLNNKRAEKLIYALKASAKKNMKMAKIKENLRNSKNIDKIKKHLKKFKIEKLYFDLQLGTKDVILTTIIITAISILMGFLLAKQEKRNIYYKFTPIYISENVYHLIFKGIISVNLVHIIYILFMLKIANKRKESDNFGKTSNRKFNANCNV